jgi:hypothetical protein
VACLRWCGVVRWGGGAGEWPGGMVEMPGIGFGRRELKGTMYLEDERRSVRSGHCCAESGDGRCLFGGAGDQEQETADPRSY